MESVRRGPLSLRRLLVLIAILAILFSWLVPTLKAMRGGETPVACLAFAASSIVVWARAHRRFTTIQVLGLIAASIATTALPLLLLRGSVPHLFPKYVATVGLLTGLWMLGLRRKRIGRA